MAIKNKGSNKVESKHKVYGNPINRVWGKIIIWVLTLAMGLTALITLVWIIVQSISQV